MDGQTNLRTRTVTWDDPFTVVRAAPGQTGLELLQQLIDKRLRPHRHRRGQAHRRAHRQAAGPRLFDLPGEKAMSIAPHIGRAREHQDFV
jgi:hypothetical protein